MDSPRDACNLPPMTKPASLQSLAKAKAMDPAYEGQARPRWNSWTKESAQPSLSCKSIWRNTNTEVRMLYARVLLSRSNFSAASDQLTRVTQESPICRKPGSCSASLQTQNQEMQRAQGSLRHFLS